MMKEISYISSDIHFINPIKVSSALEMARRRNYEVYCDTEEKCFTFDPNHLFQSIERNPVNNKITIGYYAQCPICKKYQFVGGIS